MAPSTYEHGILTPTEQLYAEPSVIYTIRQRFKVEDVIIVSPDAGGAKR